MILSTFSGEDRTANVCYQSGEFVVMYYAKGKYLQEDVALTEEDAEMKAEDYVLQKEYDDL